MTCVVALEHDGKVYIGADTAGIDSKLNIQSRIDEKVFTNKNFIFGFCGSFRMGQILRYSFTPPKIKKQDIMQYLVNDFVDKIRKTFKKKGFLSIKNEVEDIGNSSFLVGHKGIIYVFDDDLQVGKVHDDFSAIGCGQNIALGAMYATKDLKMKPEQRITYALEAAAKFSAGVRAPFNIISL